MDKQPDRVSVSLGRKISDGAYGSFDFHYSLSTDCNPGETPSDAAKRAYVDVAKWLLASETKLRKQIEQINS